MTQHRAVHSGSRWEPWLQPANGADAPVAVPAPAVIDADRTPRRRGPALALLVTLLTLGTASAGYVTGQGHEVPTPGTTRLRGPSRPDESSGRGGFDGRPDGDRRAGGRGAAGGSGVPSSGSPS